MLPEYSMARKAIWDAVNPHTGRRRIDDAFPEALRKVTNKNEMKIEFRCGSMWQVVGSDNFNSLLGSPPVGIVYSEWAVADPMAQAYLSPILAENQGWELYIYTPRGLNHGHATYQSARRDPLAFAQLLTVEDTNAIPIMDVQEQRTRYVELHGEEYGDALWRQEYFCDFAAANVGSILGPEIERADKSGRIDDAHAMDRDRGVEISSDIGFHDTAAWWFWQPLVGGFALIDYDQGTGMDADDWIDRLKRKNYRIDRIWLPHDAKVKTFQSRHSALERFIEAFDRPGRQVIGIVPQAKIADRLNAARRVSRVCKWHATNCRRGLDGLRAWQYDYNDETKIYSKEPRHDWASHPGDAFSYGCQILEERVMTIAREDEPIKGLTVGVSSGRPLDELWKEHDRARGKDRI
jgi:phage terminase large subunit